jgi:ribonuclease HII
LKTFFVGVDEVGRGCIAGPVVAAAVILKKKRNIIFERFKAIIF